MISVKTYDVAFIKSSCLEAKSKLPNGTGITMISKVEIHHFKSIEEATTMLTDVTILVGNNGSGKTNVIDSIRFLRDAAQHGLDRAFSDRHGVESVRQWAPTRPYLITLGITLVERNFQSTYSISIDSKRNEFRITREELDMREARPTSYETEDGSGVDAVDLRWTIARRERENVCKIRTKSRGFDSNLESQFDLTNNGLWAGETSVEEDYQLQPEDLMFFSRAWELLPIRGRLTNFQAYSIFPNTLRSPQEPSNETYLTPEGRNLASVFKRMRRTKRGLEAINQITDGMRSILPNLDRISVLSVGGYLVPQFHLVEPGGKKHIFNVAQMSDGTLRVLGLLTALYQEPRPSVIALEEPEQTINPGILPVIADSIKEVSRRTQVLVTTHSPHLLDQFKPDQIRSVELENDRTCLSSVSASQVSAVRDKLFTLGELLVSEGLHG